MAAIDPVCGMTVDPATAAGQTEHQGKPYYFCSQGCLAKFQADPAHYASGKALEPMATLGQPAPAPPGTEYTCPMHPEVVSDRPGACPKCGMALEPKVATLDERP